MILHFELFLRPTWPPTTTSSHLSKVFGVSRPSPKSHVILLAYHTAFRMSSAPQADPSSTATFTLYDLRIEVVLPKDASGSKIYCGAKPGDYFELRGEMLHLPPGQGFSIYSLSAVLPLLPAKQRPTHSNDWMTTDAIVACPDPNCRTQLKITRIGGRVFEHSETTAVPVMDPEAGNDH